jgi:O-antigen/teichoic acid export membrane protein
MNVPAAAGAKRVVHGVVANAYGFASSMAMQVLMVPVLVHLWGLSLFGIWVILSTIPSYLALSNIGLAGVAGNEMAALIGSGSRARARVIYATAIAIIGALTLILLVAGLTIAIVVPTSLLPSDPHIGHTEIRVAVGALVIYGVLAIATDLPMAKYRATGRYPRGSWFINTMSLLERSAVMAGATFGFAPAALSMTAVRCIGMMWMFADASRLHIDLRPRLSDASIVEAKRMALLGSGTLLFTVAMAINLQGSIMVLATALPPAAVALFSVTRQLTRFGLQATGIVGSSITAEFSLALGPLDVVRRRRLFATNFAVNTFLLTGMLVGLLIFGQFITRIWLVGASQPSFTLLALLALSAALQGLWLTTASLILAANRQFAFTPVALAIALLTVAAGAIIVPHWKLVGMAALLCTAELIMVFWIYRQAARTGVGSVYEAVVDAREMIREWKDRRYATR